MEKIIKKILCLCTIFALLGVLSLNAQSLMKKVSLESQVSNSELLVEGRVISKRSTWDENYNQIYTINTIEVYKVFKGNLLSQIEVITSGGVVGLSAQITHPSLKLRKDDVGIFSLTNSEIPLKSTAKNTTRQFKPYALSQGFYKYNLRKDLAANPYSKKTGIVSSLYSEIINYTKTPYVELKSFDVASKISKIKQSSKTALAPGNLTLNPTTITAGTKEVLTITGSGFGTTQGKVWFSNADDNGSTFISALDSQVLSWTDTEITVEVPSSAGTGDMYVENASAEVSPYASITIPYAELNVEYDIDDLTGNDPPGTNGPEPMIAYQVQHSSYNGSDNEVVWHMETDFNNDAEVSGAKAAFERAFNNWICETKINWSIGATTTTDVAADDEYNVIRFDNGELDSSTLGVCTYYYNGCDIGGGTLNWFVRGYDIEFNRDDVTWYTGTNNPNIGEYDLESVALHELGHGHQLAHVIDTYDVMHYALSNGEVQRVIGTHNSTAANAIQDRGLTSICGRTPLINNSSCPLSVDENELEKSISIYPNPTKGEFQIKNSAFINLEKAIIYDVSGRQISTHDLSNTSKEKNISINKASSGIYFISIYSEKAAVTKKIIVN